jgi:anti-sigma factor RsiW
MMTKERCINPDEIAEGDLVAYVHGAALPQVNAHIQRCAYCAQQAEELKAVDAGLLRRVYRATCPSAETLTAFAMDQLAAVERLQVAAHLRTCPHCAEEVAAARTWAQEEPTSLLQQLQEALALARVARPVAHAGAPARGRGWQGRFEVDELLITLALHGNRLTGRVRQRDASEVDLSGEAWLLSVANGGETLASASVDARGRFQFAARSLQIYTLLLQVGGQDVAVERIDLV